MRMHTDSPAGIMRDATGRSEAESLPVHVAACAERYRTLFNRLERIEGLLIKFVLGVGALFVTVAAGVLVTTINKGLGN